ncbi:MAG: hypothetical protein Q8R04_04300, partial [Nanoarchaeota archaeon]|nr:hypothetical protein [Nanoarchaeota archaeon]
AIMMGFGKILAKWRLRGALNYIVDSKDYIKINKYDTADLFLIHSISKLKKLPKDYNSQGNYLRS